MGCGGVQIGWKVVASAETKRRHPPLETPTAPTPRAASGPAPTSEGSAKIERDAKRQESPAGPDLLRATTGRPMRRAKPLWRLPGGENLGGNHALGRAGKGGQRAGWSGGATPLLSTRATGWVLRSGRLGAGLQLVGIGGGAAGNPGQPDGGTPLRFVAPATGHASLCANGAQTLARGKLPTVEKQLALLFL